MSNEENRQQTPEGNYPNINPNAGVTPGSGMGQGMQGAPQGQGFGFQQSPYYPQAPSGGQMMGGQMPQMQQMQQGQAQQPFPSQQQMMPSQPPQQPTSDVPGMLPVEESYIENILRLNKGKIATVYMTFENNERWNAKVFKGVVEAAGRDHIILSDPETGRRYLLLMVYLDYVTFDEELNYEYPYAAGAGQLSNYPPR